MIQSTQSRLARVRFRNPNGTFARSSASGKTSNAASFGPAPPGPAPSHSAVPSVLALPLGPLGFAFVNQQRPPLSKKTRCDVRQNAKRYAELHNNGRKIWCSRCVRRLHDNAAHLCDGGGAAGSGQIKCDFCSTKRRICTADTAPLGFQHRVRMTASSLARRSSDANKQAFQNALEAWSSKYLFLCSLLANIDSYGACHRDFANYIEVEADPFIQCAI